ncbi:uncharacterized protein YALI1_B00858g [Yarrowia lipolytica]|uniref:Uncharacterized protein n=1 Tax=Yarrowia lipolytica TaxID=4952 RepID=A0A1D8N5U9_YARLL|nr:hypothetical protein YALI1_B00858g [Yarrowia lipolytica]
MLSLQSQCTARHSPCNVRYMVHVALHKTHVTSTPTTHTHCIPTLQSHSYYSYYPILFFGFRAVINCWVSVVLTAPIYAIYGETARRLYLECGPDSRSRVWIYRAIFCISLIFVEFFYDY